MNLSLDFTSFVVAVSILLRGAAGIIFLFFVIPLQFKEAAVKNGLARLRKQLLISGITLFIINTLALFLIPARLYVDNQTFLNFTNTLAVLNSVAFLIVAFIKYQIYHQEYTPFNKKLHQDFEDVLEGRAKIVKLKGR